MTLLLAAGYPSHERKRVFEGEAGVPARRKEGRVAALPVEGATPSPNSTSVSEFFEGEAPSGFAGGGGDASPNNS